MSEQPAHTDVDAADLDVEGAAEVPETSDPDAFTGDPTQGGLGAVQDQAGGAG